MKTKIILFIILYSLCGNTIYSQYNKNLTTEEKQKIIDSLNSSNWRTVENAVYEIRSYNIVEAKELLEQRMWDTITYPKDFIIKALARMNSSKVHEYALAYIDTLQQDIDKLDIINDPDSTNWYDRYALVEIQVQLARILFQLDDYSKADKVIELLNYNPERPNDYALSALKYLVKKYPEQYSQLGKQKYELAIADTINLGYDRLSYFFELHHISGNETLPIAKKMFIEDKDVAVRISLLNFFAVYPPDEVIPFLKERLIIEPDRYFQGFIVNEMLGYYGSPDIYNYLSNLRSSLTNPSLKEHIDLELKNFEVSKPEEHMYLSSMIDSLQSYRQQCVNLNWIDNTLSTELSAKGQTAKTYLLSGDSLNCARQLKSFQQKVDSEYRDSLNTTTSFATKDAWKFLYTYPQYILDRLPKIPDVVPPGITSLFPTISYAGGSEFTLTVNGSLFKTGAVVQWNNLNKSTTFISDKSLQANILTSDLTVQGITNITVVNEDGGKSNVVSFTILPGVTNLLDSLISFTNQSYQKGWIDNGGILNSLIKKLENAKKDLQKNNNNAVKNKLEAYAQELQAQRGKHIKEEAFTVLKYYSDYIISGL